MQDYDEATAFLGEWGSFQRTVFFLLSISVIPNGYVGLSMVFLADTPQHHCRLPGSLNGTTGEANLSSLLPVEEVDGEMIYSRCRRYKTPVTDGFNDTKRETEPCVDGWEYSTDRYISTIVSQWDLICDDSWKEPFSMSVFFIGVFCGSFGSGHLSDRYGRKLILFLTMATQTIFNFIQVFSVNFEMFCILYFFVGLGQISNYVAAFILGTELLSKSAGAVYGPLGNCLFYALGYAIMPLFAYFIRDWRMLLLALTLPGFLYVPLWWFIPESPRWLLSKGRVEEAEAIMKAAAKQNGIRHTGPIFKDSNISTDKLSNSKYNAQRTYTYFDFFRKSNLRNITLVCWFLWIVTGASYYGLSLNTSNLNGDPYVNCLISAASEIVAYIFAWRLLTKVRRRIATASLFLIGGTLMLLIQLVPSHLQIVSVVLASIGKFCITAVFSILYFYTAELYPTVVRHMGIGASSMASRIGSVLSPYIVYLGKFNKELPFILMGVMMLISGVLSFILPETHNQSLPDTLEQTQSSRCFSCATKTNKLTIAENHEMPEHLNLKEDTV